MKLKITKVNDHLRIVNQFGNLLAIIDQYEISFKNSVTVGELQQITKVAENFDLFYFNLTEDEQSN